MQLEIFETCQAIPDAVNAIAALLQRITSPCQNWAGLIFDWFFDLIERFAPIVKPSLTEIFRIANPCIEPIRFWCCASFCFCPCPLVGVCGMTAVYPQFLGYVSELLQPLCYI
ncbi:MAG TPA: hypothetical protein HA348_07180 [Thermoplasmata archaeon]|nr:hypothetical protein [Thermoplasmata archaeon]